MKFAEEIITSRQNRIVVDAVKLCEKKARESLRLFRFDGCKLFDEALEKDVEIVRVLLSESKANGLMSKVNEHGDKLGTAVISVLSDDVFSKVSEENAPEGIICIAKYPQKHVRKASCEELEQIALDNKRRIILLESVRDPGNMGTIIRSAAAFGVDTLVISRDCADIYNPKTVRGAMGALFKMNILVFDDIVDAVNALKKCDRKVYAAALDKNAVRLNEVGFETSDTVIIGNEGHGLSEKTVGACTRSLYIPMEEGSESLNAAIAASVIMWNMYR